MMIKMTKPFYVILVISLVTILSAYAQTPPLHWLELKDQKTNLYLKYFQTIYLNP